MNIFRKFPKYCKKCGKELINYEVDSEFNPDTGRVSKKRIIIECPNFFNSIWGGNDHYYYSWEEKIND